MAERVRKDRVSKQSDARAESANPGTQGATTAGVPSDIDQILDEIDDVLESNAEDFVRNYVQKGGQ